jgi:hypothetical protein
MDGMELETPYISSSARMSQPGQNLAKEIVSRGDFWTVGFFQVIENELVTDGVVQPMDHTGQLECPAYRSDRINLLPDREIGICQLFSKAGIFRGKDDIQVKEGMGSGSIGPIKDLDLPISKGGIAGV